MATVIDSKTTQLEPAQVVMEFSGSYNTTNLPPAAFGAALIKEFSMPNTDIVQYGNTVFIGHRGTGKNKHQMWGRGLTVDTAQNFIVAGLKYFTHLQDLGVTHYRTQYDGNIYDSAFRAWKRYADRADTKVAAGRAASGKTQGFVMLGKIPLAEVV